MQYRNIDKQALKENGYTVLAKISIVGTDTVFTEDDYIVDWDYEDYRYVPNNGFIGQFVERILDGNLQNISDGVILEDTEINLKLGIKNALDNNTITWYDYGNFLITKVEKTDTTGNYRFESADYTKKFNIPFKDYVEIEGQTIPMNFPVLAMELMDFTCFQAGVQPTYSGDGTCSYYIVPEEGLTPGNYYFEVYEDTIKYINFTTAIQLEKNDVLLFIPSENKLIQKTVKYNQDHELVVNRTELTFTKKTTHTGSLLEQRNSAYIDFTNNDFVIESNQYDSEDTCRKVMQDIGKLAYSWVRVGEDNNVHIDFTPKSTSDIDQYDQLTTDEYYVSKKSDLTFGPVNKVLIGMSDVEGENLYITSQDYTEETECAIKIYDNNLTNTEELRAIALYGAERLFGLQYTPIEINSVGHPWLDGDELIKLTNVDNEVIYTYPFNRKIHYAGYIEGVIGAEASTTQNTKYEYKSDIISNVKRTAIIVDKQEQTITALAENVDENSSNISQMQIDLNGIDLRVQSVETTEVTGVTNEYAVNTSATNPPAQSSSDWSETKPTRGEGEYIWARIKTTYKNGNIEYSEPVNTTGDKGDTGGAGPTGPAGEDGEDGKGIVSVTELYYVSNSSTAPSKPGAHITRSDLVTYNAWNLQCPPYTTTYKYFFTCSEILYTDNTYGWTNVTQNQGLSVANQNAYNADSKATSAKAYTDALSAQYGYRYKKDIVIYGDAEDKYYPVYFAGGNQNVPREIMIIRGYSEQAPASWNTSTHKGGLMFRAKANYGAWGGVTYTCEILDFTEMYSKMIADIRVSQLSGYGCTIWMRGGGTTGAIYHVYSDQPIETTIPAWHTGTFPFIGTTAGDIIGYWGGDTPETATNKWLVENPLSAPDTTRLTNLQTKTALAALDTYVDTNIQNLQSQIDGAIQFWNGANIPTLSNYPANQWTTEADRTNHQADIYTVIQDVSGELKQGKSYRFDKVSGTWTWIELTDNELSAVQALAASKAKVYVVQPTPPYNVGDLWLNNNNLYKCKTAKAAGTSFAVADWELATDYTNDDTANQALDKIVNMVIGGRNYYLDSDTFTAAGSGATGITPTIVNNEWKIVVASPNGNWHSWSHSNIIEDNFKTGDKFTFSFEIKSADATVTTPPKIYFKNGMGYYTMTGSVSSNWSRVYYTGTWNDTNNIQTHFGWSGLSGTYYIRRLKFEAGDKATDWTVAPEDIDAEINDAITEIGNQLSNYVTTTTYDADWQNRKDEIYSYVNVNYTTTSDFGTYQETMQTALSQKADATTISATATQVVNDAISGIQSTVSNIEETFTFDTNGLTIARGGNTMYLQLQNDRLSFRTDDTDAGERAYMTSNAFVLKELAQFQIGNFKFEVRTNGSLDFKKV